MYSVMTCSGQSAKSTAKFSALSRLASSRKSRERRRAIRVGTLKTVCASLQATRLIWSLGVTAMIMSASSAPALRMTDGTAPLPVTVRRSSLSCSIARRAASLSTTVMSFSSDTRPSATLAPTWPAPRIMTFMSPPPRLVPDYSSPRLPSLTSSCFSLRYRCVRSRPERSASFVILPPSRRKWCSK